MGQSPPRYPEDEKSRHLSTDEPVARTDSVNAISQKILKHSHDGDEALKALESYGDGAVVEIDEATNRRLLRKIDWNLIPIMCVVYGLNYLDKSTLGYAAVMGLQDDIHLQGDNYQWLGSMFYFGYLAWEYPTNRLLQRLPLGKYSAVNVFLWGVTLASFAGVSNFGEAVAARFFLGIFEAAVTPGFSLLTSQWYTKEEQGFRTSIWFCFNGFAQIFGGCVAYGIAVGIRLHGAAMPGWKILFLTTGLLTAIIGVIFFFTVPDNQLNARWLSKEDRRLAIERIRRNQQGVGNKHWKWYQMKEALLDPQTWMMVFYALVADIPNGGISNFFTLLIKSFGFTSEKSLLIATPGGAVEVVTLLLWGLCTAYFGQRILFSIPFMVLSLLGVVLIVALPNSSKNGHLCGYYLTQASPAGFVALLSLISTNVAGYTKKTTVAAMYLIAYCVGNIIGPQTFRPKDQPTYTPAKITIIVCWVLCILDLLLIYGWLIYQNKKKEKQRQQPGYVRVGNAEFMDLTDRENPEFIYTL